MAKGPVAQTLHRVSSAMTSLTTQCKSPPLSAAQYLAKLAHSSGSTNASMSLTSSTIHDNCKLANLEKYHAKLESKFCALGNKFDGEAGTCDKGVSGLQGCRQRMFLSAAHDNAGREVREVCHIKVQVRWCD